METEYMWHFDIVARASASQSVDWVSFPR